MFSLTSNAHSVLGSQACHAARLAAEAAGEEARAAVAQELNALRRRVEDAHLNGYLDEGSSGGSGHLPSYYTSTQAAGGVGTNNNHATGALVATTTGEAATVEIAVLRAALKESEEEAAMLRAAVATSSAVSTDATGKAQYQSSTRPRMPSPTAARDALLRVDTAVAAAAASSSLSTPPANFGRRSPTNGGAPRAASSTSFARSSSPLGKPPLTLTPYVYCRMLGCQPVRNLHQVDVKTCTKYEIYPSTPLPIMRKPTSQVPSVKEET